MEYLSRTQVSVRDYIFVLVIFDSFLNMGDCCKQFRPKSGSKPFWHSDSAFERSVKKWKKVRGRQLMHWKLPSMQKVMDRQCDSTASYSIATTFANRQNKKWYQNRDIPILLKLFKNNFEKIQITDQVLSTKVVTFLNNFNNQNVLILVIYYRYSLQFYNANLETLY